MSMAIRNSYNILVNLASDYSIPEYYFKIQVTVAVLIKDSENMIHEKLAVSGWHNFLINFCHLLSVQFPIGTIVGKPSEKYLTAGC